jgi:alkylated DNA repair dioxygenase AlkB
MTSATAQATAAAPITLTPNVSPLGPRRWRPFVEDVELSSYSYYLPHIVPSSSASSAADDDGDDNDDDYAIPPSPAAAFSSSRLDEWYRSLHPSGYVEEPHGSAWTDASYRGQPLLRKTAWSVLDGRCTCEYGYSDNLQRLVTSPRMTGVLREITSEVSRVVGCFGEGGEVFNSVNLNYYPRGGGVGFHADDEFLFDGINSPTRIISLSLCGRRRDDDDDDDTEHSGERVYRVKRKARPAGSGRRRDPAEGVGGGGGSLCDDIVSEITLRHGDIITMEGMFQRYYLHSVWPGDDDDRAYVDHELCRGERINLTWRTIVRHLDGSDKCRGLVCPMAAGEVSGGRQF